MTEPIRANQNSWSSRFWQEFRLVPRWLVWTMSLLLVASQINNFLVNRWAFQHGGEIFLPQLRNTPGLSSLALAGFAAVISLVPISYFLLVAYVNRDAKRRGMNPNWWTILQFLLLPGSLVAGPLLYFLTRKPLPYPCPHCSVSLLPRFHFCPKCKYDLRAQRTISQS